MRRNGAGGYPGICRVHRAELKMLRGFGRFVGTSAALERTLKQARAVADTNATVLLTGENGTGKEVVAVGIELGFGYALQRGRMRARPPSTACSNESYA